ncbi:MAG: ABC transporter permease [Puniceicoccaceae bacterium]
MNLSFLQDLRFGLRLVKRSPWVSALAIFCLAAGIGLTTFMFGITWAVVGRGLPFPDQERIIHVQRADFQDFGDGRTLIQVSAWDSIQEQQSSFASLSAFAGDGVTVGLAGFPNRMNGAYVTNEFFDIMKVTPMLGRAFAPDDYEAAGGRVLILSHSAWKQYFASDPNIVGVECICEGQPYTIVGVMPEDYDYPFGQEVWIPLIPEMLESQTAWIDFVTLIGRLDDGVSLDEARAEFDLIFSRLEELERTPDMIHQPPNLEPFFNRFVGDEVRVLMWSMFGATFLVLLIACSNVSSIMTARMVVRSNELAIRSALGASRRRIVTQILGETLLYGLFGAIIGLAVAAKALEYLWLWLSQHRFAPPSFMEFRLDPVSVIVAFSLLIVAVVVSGILPSLRSSKPNIVSLLNDSQRTGSSKRLGLLSSVSTIMQVAFSFALLVAAGRLIAAIIMMGTLEYPFDEKGLLVGSLAIDGESYPETDDSVKFWEDIHRELETIPGAENVSLGFNMPCVFAMSAPVQIDGVDYVSEEDYPEVRFDVVAPNYFNTLKVEILNGRDFDDTDRWGEPNIAIINTVMAEKFWPQENPIGKIFHMRGAGDYPTEEDRVHRVVGVVPDLKMAGLVNDEDDGAGFYKPQAQALWGDQKIFLRTNGNPKALIPDVQNAINLIDPNVAFSDAMTFEEHVTDAFFYFRFFMNLFSTFGGMALLLASAGIYGIIQYSVSQRIVEIGIRMCLGATPDMVLKMVFLRGIRNTIIGILIGAVISVGLVQVLAAVFQGVPNEYYSYITALVVLILVSAIANGLPAIRAAKLDPMVALRVQ